MNKVNGVIKLKLADFTEFWKIRNNTSKAEAQKAIETFVETFKDAVLESGSVEMRGFLNVHLESMPARDGFDPRNGKAIKIPAKRLVKAKVMPGFKYIEENERTK